MPCEPGIISAINGQAGRWHGDVHDGFGLDAFLTTTRGAHQVCARAKYGLRQQPRLTAILSCTKSSAWLRMISPTQDSLRLFISA